MSEIQRSGKEAVVIPTQDIVAAQTRELHQELLELVQAGVEQVQIDLSAVEMIDSSGLGVIISTQNSLQNRSGSLRVVNASDNILKLFRIMRLDSHFQVEGRTN
jgi:anti-anti-sigma factor